ncbi:uncharacterized protein LOC111613415 [Centruroides sculpturatus]|uniref:uncharacterized protein LOC111613415 n=1 Tax=Centruroides sculpturatus TaxID=218467 RepID=UPI000C6EAB70|nr:uncharacterized protein LOC111613415 [Centruroides sculpturatus]
MENNKEKDYKIQIKLLYLLNLLLFLFVLVFVIIYSPQNNNIRMASPDIEERYIKTKEGDANINSDISRHQLKIRDVSSKTECGEKDEDAVMLNGKCSIKKSELCEYCLTLKAICERNVTETEGEQEEKKDDSEEKIKQESRHCILDNVTDYQIFPFPLFNVSRRLAFAQFEENSEGNFDIWLKEREKPVIQEYRLNENGTYEILKEFRFPETMTDWGIVYNGSYYGRYDFEHKIFKYNFQTWESKIGDKIFHIPRVDFFSFCIDEDSIWVFNVIDPRLHVIHEALQIDPENLEILSKQIVDNAICLIRYGFVAYGKIYCFEDLKNVQISFISDKTEKEIPYIALNVDKEIYNEAATQFYNFKEQRLYVLYQSYKSMSYTLHRFKLHFNCSSEE